LSLVSPGAEVKFRVIASNHLNIAAIFVFA
jgi:hypothetical protein